MDTRKLEILKNDQTTMLSLVEPGAGGEVIARIDPATVHSEPLREVRRRYNAYRELVAFLDDFVNDLDHKAGESGDDPTSFDARYDGARSLLSSLNA